MSTPANTFPQKKEFLENNSALLTSLRALPDLESCRRGLYEAVTAMQYAGLCEGDQDLSAFESTIVRDCARVLRSILARYSDDRAGFSVVQALWDLARKRPRPDLGPGFFAELNHLFQGLSGSPLTARPDATGFGDVTGQEAARRRSLELDQIWTDVENRMARFVDGLRPDSVARRAARRQQILDVLGGTDEDWANWHWQARHIITTAEDLARLVRVDDHELAAVRKALETRQPFGITPYYASLMDDDPKSGMDRTIRAQVIPPMSYVDGMAKHAGDKAEALDFMREADTSPIDLITRRYPSIVILKPFNTCPQICVYCQRNWEIERPMAPGAMAPKSVVDRALDWIAEHPAISEVLVTGGDPFAMSDRALRRILERLAGIGHIEMIRVGTRMPVTMPMRVTPELAGMLGSFREPGRRDVCVVTHIEHVSEVTPDMVQAVERLKRHGLSVYNQMVYTFFVSRRFEAAALRRLLRRCGIDPYYTFAPKGKEETAAYRVPIARILQEQKEEARLLPGTRRTDAAVFNVPGLGKNHLLASQHRDIVSILPDGSRVYEFHPWEKNIVERESYLGQDVPILEYLKRLHALGENPDDYSTIWYYF